MPARRIALFAAVAIALTASPLQPAVRAASTSFRESDYWAVADRVQERLDPVWDPAAGYYRATGTEGEAIFNGAMLLTHAVAALQDHRGPARNDARARTLAERLVSTPPFVTEPAGARGHAPGWVASMHDAIAGQHVVFDAEIVEGLVAAYRARDALALPAATVERIRLAIDGTVRGPFWRYPAIRLNQVNWYALMYAADATVTGDPTLLRHDLAHQLRRFFAGVRGRRGQAGNLGPGLRFHYLPQRPAEHPMNLDSAEYADIVLSFTRFLEQARAAGMPPLARADQRVLGEWLRRALAGYWTHGGYLNWDTGLGFARWHQTKKLGLAQQALIGIAATPAAAGAEWASWAKYLFDRSLAFYERMAARDGGIAAPLLFGVHEVPERPANALLAAARVESNAARAIDAGLGARPGAEPPALYAFDPDIGRLAVTTPTYNTAIVPVNQGAFPYGGLDLARLYDGDQEVAANIGGTPPASFGALIRDRSGRRVLASQLPRRRPGDGPPLRLISAPRGANASAAAVGRAYAAPFTDLRATGVVAGATAAIRVTHRFTPRWIQTRWEVTRRAGAPRYAADVLFPSWGGGARVEAVLRGGRSVVLGGTPLALADISRLVVHSERSGYDLVPLNRPAGASARLLTPHPQPSNPRPGATLAIALGPPSAFSRRALTVRITPR